MARSERRNILGVTEINKVVQAVMLVIIYYFTGTGPVEIIPFLKFR